MIYVQRAVQASTQSLYAAGGLEGQSWMHAESEPPGQPLGGAGGGPGEPGGDGGPGGVGPDGKVEPRVPILMLE